MKGQKPRALTLTLVSGFMTELPRKKDTASFSASAARSQRKHSLPPRSPSQTGMVSSL
jgi:hypothetical protein